MRAVQACRVGIAVLAVMLIASAGTAQAAGGIKLCIPKHEGGSVVTPKHGKCPKGSGLTTLGAEGKAGKTGAEGKAGAPGPEGKQGPAGVTGLSGAELETLQKMLPYMTFVSSGVAGKATV